MALTLTHTTGEWDGTFAITAAYLLSDILSDGAPINNVTIVSEPVDVNVPDERITHVGTVTDVIGGHVHLTTGEGKQVEIELAYAVSVEVA